MPRSDVCLAVGCYLRHREAVDAYLRAQEAEAERAQREHEAAHPRTLTREGLLRQLENKVRVL